MCEFINTNLVVSAFYEPPTQSEDRRFDNPRYKVTFVFVGNSVKSFGRDSEQECIDLILSVIPDCVKIEIK